MRHTILAMMAVVASAGAASAQGLEYKPIDTSKFLVQPTDAATGIMSGTVRYISRAAAGIIDGNGYVKTLNNLLGRSPTPKQTTQIGPSPLPLPGSYPSVSYKNSFRPMMPTYSTYGQSVK